MIRLGSNFTQLRFQRAKFQEVEEKKTEDKKAEEKKAEDTAPNEENKNDGTNTKKTDLSNFFDQNYLLPITFKPIKTKPTPAVPENNDEPKVDEKDEETPTTNKTDGVSGNETETKKLTEDEIKAAIKKSAPDITDYQMNQLLTTISSYDNLDSSSIESAVKKLMRNYNNDKNTIIMAANTINADTGESLMQEDFRSIINYYTPAVPENNDEPEVYEKDEETPTTNKTDGVSGNETETKKLTEDEIKAAIKKSAPDITDYQMNQLLTTISSYDNLDSSSIESAVKKLMRNYNNDKNTIIMAANTINADTGESLMQEDFRSIINYYTAAVDKNSSGEKNKPTLNDLNNMFTDYKNTMEKVRGMYNPSSTYEDLIIRLQGVIDRNNLDINLNNLMSFFEYIQENMPTGGAMASSQWLIIEFNNFIENGYTDERATLERQADKLYNSFVGGNNGTTNSDFDEKLKKIEEERKAIEEEIKNKLKNDDVNRVFNETGDKPSGGVTNTVPTPEELEQIKNRINGIVDSTFFD